MRRSDDTPWTSGTHPKCRVFLILDTPCNMLPCNCHEALKGLAVDKALTIICFGRCLPDISYLQSFRFFRWWLMNDDHYALVSVCVWKALSPSALEFVVSWFQGDFRGTRRLPPLRYCRLPLDLCTLHKCDQTLNMRFHSSTLQGLGVSAKQNSGGCLFEEIKPFSSCSLAPSLSVCWCSQHLCFTLGI